ncbi:hypothetical protein QE152_g15623 [Popillia japonica]|uniref:Transposase n=1 Tax=Popillia japonica TaxID=7064 RepID=A0AAW1L779_POPJA
MSYVWRKPDTKEREPQSHTEAQRRKRDGLGLYECIWWAPAAQSPGMNIIRNLWATWDNNIRKHEISSRDELKKVLLGEWQKITSEITKKLVASMPKRMQAIVNVQSYQSKYRAIEKDCLKKTNFPKR